MLAIHTSELIAEVRARAHGLEHGTRRLILEMAERLEILKQVDIMEVEDPELLKAIKLLIKQYAHSKASDYVHSPVAHALFHTWKQVENGR